MKSRMRTAAATAETSMMRRSGFRAPVAVRHDLPVWTAHSNVQGRRVNSQDRQRRGEVAAVLSLVVYWFLVHMPYQTEGDGILCWWRWRRRKGEIGANSEEV